MCSFGLLLHLNVEWELSMCEQNVFSNEMQGGLGPGVCCPKTIVQATSKMEALAFALQLLRYTMHIYIYLYIWFISQI